MDSLIMLENSILEDIEYLHTHGIVCDHSVTSLIPKNRSALGYLLANMAPIRPMKNRVKSTLRMLFNDTVCYMPDDRHNMEELFLFAKECCPDESIKLTKYFRDNWHYLMLNMKGILNENTFLDLDSLIDETDLTSRFLCVLLYYWKDISSFSNTYRVLFSLIDATSNEWPDTPATRVRLLELLKEASDEWKY